MLTIEDNMKYGLPIEIDLPEGFLEKEVRCGYEVPSEMKKVWAIQLDVLDQVLKCCNRHQIDVWMAGGSLLGAVRHKGYIPWDDDVDVMMSRKDFRLFCKFACKELPKDLFLQTQYTEPCYIGYFARVRKLGTAQISLSEAKNSSTHNMGIAVDVFPLDVFSTSKVPFAFRVSTVVENLRQVAHKPARKFYSERHTFLGKLRRILCLVLRLRFVNHILTWANEFLFSRYGDRKDWPYFLCPAWWNHFTKGSTDCSRWIYPQDWFSKTILLPFEFLKVLRSTKDGANGLGVINQNQELLKVAFHIHK